MLLRCAPLALLLACPGPSTPPAQCGFEGDAAKSIELIAFAADASGALHEVHAGDSVLLQRPSQGGFVVYAGAAARNLEICGVQYTAELIDPSSGSPLTGLDQRRADLTVANGGYYWPGAGLSHVANIPSCPDALHVGVAGKSAVLRVDVLDSAGRSARIEVNVTPVCPSGDASCPCVCGPNPGGC